MLIVSRTHRHPLCVGQAEPRGFIAGGTYGTCQCEQCYTVICHSETTQTIRICHKSRHGRRSNPARFVLNESTVRKVVAAKQISLSDIHEEWFALVSGVVRSFKAFEKRKKFSCFCIFAVSTHKMCCNEGITQFCQVVEKKHLCHFIKRLKIQVFILVQNPRNFLIIPNDYIKTLHLKWTTLCNWCFM